jgi:hypothetical protein
VSRPPDGNDDPRRARISDGAPRSTQVGDGVSPDRRAERMAAPPPAPPALHPERSAALAAWLARFPPSSAIWTVLPHVAEAVALEEWGGAPDAERDDVPPEVASAARSLMGFGMVVGFYKRAPRSMIDGIRAMSAARSQKPDGEQWFLTLCLIFKSHEDGFPVVRIREQVQFVLRVLAYNVALTGIALPAALRAPTKERLREAEHALQRMAGTHRGRRYGPEGRAREFAAAFGLHPPRRGDVGRKR